MADVITFEISGETVIRRPSTANIEKLLATLEPQRRSGETDCDLIVRCLEAAADSWVYKREYDLLEEAMEFTGGILH